MFEVMMIIVLRKSTFLPRLSVNCPSSKTCNNKLNTSGWAFSISSSNTTEYGLRRTFQSTVRLLHNLHIPEAHLLNATPRTSPYIRSYQSGSVHLLNQT